MNFPYVWSIKRIFCLKLFTFGFCWHQVAKNLLLHFNIMLARLSRLKSYDPKHPLTFPVLHFLEHSLLVLHQALTNLAKLPACLPAFEHLIVCSTGLVFGLFTVFQVQHLWEMAFVFFPFLPQCEPLAFWDCKPYSHAYKSLWHTGGWVLNKQSKLLLSLNSQDWMGKFGEGKLLSKVHPAGIQSVSGHGNLRFHWTNLTVRSQK